MEQDFWRRFIDRRRKSLAQAINFLYPASVAWQQDPTPTISSLFPLDEFARLLNELPEDDPLDEVETKGIERMHELLKGKYHTPFEQ